MTAPRRPSDPPPVWPLFLPQQGCGHRCVFCNQPAATGQAARPLRPEAVRAFLARQSKRCAPGGRAAELAFYGGSFTALPWREQEQLLAAVQPWIGRGEVSSIRLSTRPDALDLHTCRLLADYGVRTVEIGVQSLDNQVLALCRRGHDAAASLRAIELLRRFDMRVGAHLMLGLPGERRGSFVSSVRRLLACPPDFVRLHPTLVLRDTTLARWYVAGRYRPLSLAAAVARCCQLKELFAGAGIPVLRLGLQETDSLRRSLVAGPHHPAFGELVLGRLLFKRVRACLAHARQRSERTGPFTAPSQWVLRIARRDLSLLYGPDRRCWRRLGDLGLLAGVRVAPDGNLPRGVVCVKGVCPAGRRAEGSRGAD